MLGGSRPYTIAYPAGDRLGGMTSEEIRLRVSLPGPRQILFLGAVIPRKGVDVLLQRPGAAKRRELAVDHCRQSDQRPKPIARKIFRLISTLGLTIEYVCLEFSWARI